MSLRQLVQDQVASAFSNSMGDLPVTLVYTEPGEYDPATGSTGADTEYTINDCMAVGYSQNQINDTTVKATDKKFLLPAKFVTFTPTTKGSITHDGVVYQVHAQRLDPAGALWVIQGRI